MYIKIMRYMYIRALGSDRNWLQTKGTYRLYFYQVSLPHLPCLLVYCHTSYFFTYLDFLGYLWCQMASNVGPHVYLTTIVLQNRHLKFTYRPELTTYSIMRDCARNWTQLNTMKRKLNKSGNLQQYCGLINRESKLKKLKNSLQLTQSMTMVQLQFTSWGNIT
jgi:hypothetical protein